MERLQPFDFAHKVFDLLLQFVFAHAFLPLSVHQLPILKVKIIDKTAGAKPLSEDMFLHWCGFEFEVVCLNDGHCVQNTEKILATMCTDNDCALSRRSLPSKQGRPRTLRLQWWCFHLTAQARGLSRTNYRKRGRFRKEIIREFRIHGS